MVRMLARLALALLVVRWAAAVDLALALALVLVLPAASQVRLACLLC
jgi:hypothetical protein